jgi:hypothetical protein
MICATNRSTSGAAFFLQFPKEKGLGNRMCSALVYSSLLAGIIYFAALYICEGKNLFIK